MSQSIENFAALMNEEAARLGATGTHFVNPHGLHDENHYTTAYDLYLIFNEALKYPKFREVTKTVAYTANYKDKDGGDVSKVWEGGNWYLTGKRQAPEGRHRVLGQDRHHPGRGLLSGHGVQEWGRERR